MKLFSRKKPLKTTPLSEFVRNTSSEGKKRIYREVLVRATERQKAVLAGKASESGAKARG